MPICGRSTAPPEVDERTAERLLYVDATLAEMRQLAARGREAYDLDIAIARACQWWPDAGRAVIR